MLAARGQLANTVAVGDPHMLRQRAERLGLTVAVVEATPGSLDVSIAWAVSGCGLLHFVSPRLQECLTQLTPAMC